MSTVLISGVNKGIGNGLVKKYLALPNTTVIGTVRDPSAPASKDLYDLPKAEGSRIIVVKIESTSDTDALEAIKSLSAHDIDHIDIVIANAGIFSPSAFQKVSEMKPSDLLHHCDVNAAGTVRLFQAVLPLLENAAVPKFVAMSTAAATIADTEVMLPFNISSYGASKAALNYSVRKIHFENEGLIAFAVHPGLVETDAAVAAAEAVGLSEGFISVPFSVDTMVTKIDAATREETGGKFISVDETPLLW